MSAPPFSLVRSCRIHVVGVGGAGMSPIALVLAAAGHHVSGSDVAASPSLDRVTAAGVTTHVGHDITNLAADLDALVVTTAIGVDSSTNVEVAEARRRGLPVLRRAEVLAAIGASRRTIGVAGTHGKTTTSTLLALVLQAGGLEPGWIIGGEVLGESSGARWGSGEWFVVEADESDGTFNELGAAAAIVTSVEPDHLEYHGGWDELQAAFATYVEAIEGPVVLCADDAGAAALAARSGAARTYGTDTAAHYVIGDLDLGRFDASFTVTHRATAEQTNAHLPIAGLYNVRNAAAALAMGHALGVPLAVGAEGVGEFPGVRRRFHRRGEADGVTVVDDYAHLPGEVAAVTAAARAGGWRRVVAVFQPHRYSRTEQVGADFGGAFDAADVVVLTDVYGAGEPVRDGIDGQIVRRAVEATNGHPPVVYVPERSALAVALAEILEPGDLCLTLGAGDITKLADEVLPLLEVRSASPTSAP